MKCVYANWHDGNPPCCTHDCEGCVWCVEDEAEEGEEQREYEAAVEAAQYCEMYEPTYDPETGAM